jgi:phosphoribosyl 1,2-cyclic phosphodiesterase
MSMRFIVLASGSAGNVTYLEADGFGLLIDLGLGPRQLDKRLAAAGLRWQQVRAVLLTHTHADHWSDRSFAHLQQFRIPLYCHYQHHRVLRSCSSAFVDLGTANLVMAYEPGERFRLSPGLSCLAFRVHHDSGLTCGFRFEGPADMYGERPALAYASDLGTWDAQVAQLMTDVDVLAVEFNHDVLLQKNSGRSARMIARNLGNKGHLSNEQAAALVHEVQRLSSPGRPGHVVQLHLSRECNRPELALQAVERALGEGAREVQVHAASQDAPGPYLTIGDAAGSPMARRRSARLSAQSSAPEYLQPRFPGFEE